MARHQHSCYERPECLVAQLPRLHPENLSFSNNATCFQNESIKPSDRRGRVTPTCHRPSRPQGWHHGHSSGAAQRPQPAEWGKRHLLHILHSHKKQLHNASRINPITPKEYMHTHQEPTNSWRRERYKQTRSRLALKTKARRDKTSTFILWNTSSSSNSFRRAQSTAVPERNVKPCEPVLVKQCACVTRKPHLRTSNLLYCTTTSSARKKQKLRANLSASSALSFTPHVNVFFQ